MIIISLHVNLNAGVDVIWVNVHTTDFQIPRGIMQIKKVLVIETPLISSNINNSRYCEDHLGQIGEDVIFERDPYFVEDAKNNDCTTEFVKLIYDAIHHPGSFDYVILRSC